MNTDRLIPMDDIELQFNQHLKLSNNERIIFSGRFGTGKTTFLNHFFDNQMEYNVIKLYPLMKIYTNLLSLIYYANFFPKEWDAML